MSYPEPTNITDFTGFFEYANTVTNNGACIGILIAFFIVSFIAMKVFQTERAVLASMFLTTLVSIFFTVLGLVSSKVMVVCIILTGFALLHLKYSGE